MKPLALVSPSRPRPYRPSSGWHGRSLPTVEQLARAVQTARHGKDWPGVDEHCKREAAAILAALAEPQP